MRTLLLLIVLAVLLAIFNPDMAEFKTFVRDRAELLLQRETGESALGRALSGAGASFVGEYVDRVTERTNYFVFSTYTIDLDGPDEEGEEWKFLGIATQFIELNRPDFVEEQLGDR